MARRRLETAAVVLTVVGVSAALLVPGLHGPGTHLTVPPGAQVVTLTALAESGVWTTETVTGANYWRTDFAPARPVLRAGKPTVLRLISADVVHSFYAPGLDLGPILVRPGHVEEVVVTPETEGVFTYYCTTACGDPHFGMLGEFVVGDPASRAGEGSYVDHGTYWKQAPPPAGSRRAARGSWLFYQKGCVTCHGMGGLGGIRNDNHVSDTVPALNTLARKMSLFRRADIEVVVGLLERRVALSTLEGHPPVLRFEELLTQYDSARNVIRRGAPPARKDPGGPLPPLEMPAWAASLSDDDIDALITYLLSLGEEGEIPDESSSGD